MFNRLSSLARVIWKLGLSNVLNVLIYRVKLKVGYVRFCTPVGPPPGGDVFKSSSVKPNISPLLIDHLISEADYLLDGVLPRFFGERKKLGVPPNWFQLDENNSEHWSNQEINSKLGSDIKLTWDASRFQWAQILAASYGVTNNSIYLDALNEWVTDWWVNNPPNTGVNWFCAQEVSIRLLHLLNAAYLLGQHNEPSDTLVKFVEIHCERIMPTLQYSIAQANNHGVSEAVGLLIGGAWLEKAVSTKKQKEKAHVYANRGRKVLEKLIASLVSRDGSFSMYSLNYHRVVLDTLSLAEFWRRTLELEAFSQNLVSSASNMVDYLYAFVDETSGDVPNLGTNDGSRSYLLTASGYRDFRPTVQLGARLFQERLKFAGADSIDALDWMGVGGMVVNESPSRNSVLFNDCGYAILIPEGSKKSWAAMSYPQYRFRPSHSDQLHFDLWYEGRNIFCDSGTYSYNTDPDLENYFIGCRGHNVIQFDSREPMPRFGRFLMLDWLVSNRVAPISKWRSDSIWNASYQDSEGAEHSRSVHYDDNVWIIRDEIKGYKEKAIIRWHLGDLEWVLEGNYVSSDGVRISIIENKMIKRIELQRCKRSLFYSTFSEALMLEVEVGAGLNVIEIVTEVHLG